MFKSPAWASLIDVKSADGLVSALSRARLASYGLPSASPVARELSLRHQTASNDLGSGSYGEIGIDAVARHARNITLCEAMYPILHMLEVVMRNSIHNACCQHFGAADWYDQGWLNNNHQRFVADAKRELSKRSKPHDPDRIIAELGFGFWCGMFHSSYEHGPRALWPTLLTAVMPNIPKSWRTRFKVQRRVEDARSLRNRVFHHESIAHLTDLRERHRRLIEVLGWFSSDSRQHIESICRFKLVHDDSLILLDQAAA